MPASDLADSLLVDCRVRNTPCTQGELLWREWSSVSTSSQPPQVLLHGGFGSWNHWVANIGALKEHRRLLVPDLPGLGESADMPEPHTTTHFAEILLRGLDQLLGPGAEFDLGGFSFGAMVGAHLARLAGSRCHRFTAIGAAGFGELHVQVPLQRPPGPGTPADEAKSIHRANLRTLMFSSDEPIDALAVQLHAHNLARHRFNSRRLSLTDDFVQVLPQIRARLVGVWGSRDATAGGRPAIEKRRALFLSAQPDAGFHILEGVGHWAMYEAPGPVNRILLGD